MTPERVPQKNPIDLSPLETMPTVREKLSEAEDLLNGANPEKRQDLVLKALAQAQQEYQRVKFYNKDRQVRKIMQALERGEVSPDGIFQAIKPQEIQEEEPDGLWSKARSLFSHR